MVGGIYYYRCLHNGEVYELSPKSAYPQSSHPKQKCAQCKRPVDNYDEIVDVKVRVVTQTQVCIPTLGWVKLKDRFSSVGEI